MYFQHAINNDAQTRLLNVLGQIAMILGDKKNYLINGTILEKKKGGGGLLNTRCVFRFSLQLCLKRFSF